MELRRRGELAIEDEGERFGARGVAHSLYVRDPDGLTVEVRTYDPLEGLAGSV